MLKAWGLEFENQAMWTVYLYSAKTNAVSLVHDELGAEPRGSGVAITPLDYLLLGGEATSQPHDAGFATVSRHGGTSVLRIIFVPHWLTTGPETFVV